MNTSQNSWSRRKFVASLSGAGTLILFNPSLGWAFKGTAIDPKVAAIVAKTMGIDTHNHIDVPLNAAELPGPKVELSAQLKKSGLTAICMTFAVDYQDLSNPADGYSRFIKGLDAMDIVLKENNISRALNMQDLIAAKNNNKPTVIQSVEGSHFLEGQVNRVALAYDRGLRHLTLLHDHDASKPLGDVYTNNPQWGGLTKLGSDVIKECNRLGILVDLAHGSNDTVNAALKVATKPVMISHTGLDTQLGQNPFMAKMMRPRLISKEQAKIVADAGGIIGVWTHLADSPLEYAQNIRALVDVIGVDHICIGTDTKLTPSYRAAGGGQPGQGGDKKHGNQDGPKPDNREMKNSNGNPDKAKGKERVGERTNNAWKDQKESFYYAVVDAMLKTGFTEDEIGKIGGGNFCRVFDAATKGH